MVMIYIIIAAIVLAAAIVLYKNRSADMAHGIQIFNSSGNLTFDLANKTTYILGTGQTGASNGSISNSKITTRAWVVVLSCPADGQIPYFSAEQGKITWQFLGGQIAPSAKNVTFMYGVY